MMKQLLCLFQLFLISGLHGQELTVNKAPLDFVKANSDEYSFIISGHFYGDGFNETHYPANTILGNISLLNNSDFTVCLGDLYKDVKNDHEIYKTGFYKYLTKPLYNAVGNHDVSGSFYEDIIAPRFYSFSTKGISHIVLDTERDDSSIKDDQLDSLGAWVQRFCASSDKYLNIYSHRPIWAEEDSMLSKVFAHNTKSVFGTNFKKDVVPILSSVPASKTVYWFSGSMGPQPYSFFYHKTRNIIYAVTAIRGAKKDALLKANYRNGELTFETKSLTGQELLSFEEYSVDKFITYEEPVQINYRLIPLWIKNTLIHRYFWYGVLCALFTIFAAIVIRNKFS